MKWTFEQIHTNDDGSVASTQALTGIINRFSIEERAGDELFVEHGDIQLESRSPFTITSPGKDWLLANFEGVLYQAYLIEKDYDEFNIKSRLYKSTLKPIQGVFYKDLSDIRIQYSTAGEDWSNNLAIAKVIIDKINTGVTNVINTWGFSLDKILENIKGSHKHHHRGYYIDSLSLPVNLPLIGSDKLPIIFRGQSLHESNTEEDAMNKTFGTGERKTYWMDFFKLALYTYNCYLKVQPYNIFGNFYIDVTFIRRKYSNPFPPSVRFTEKRIIKNKYRIDGVKIEGENFTFTDGLTEGADLVVFDKTLAISDPQTAITALSETLFWGGGDYLSGGYIYNIFDGSSQNTGYFELGEIENSYADIISNSDGLEGTIFFEGQRVLEYVTDGIDTIQIIRINPSENGLAKVEGILV